VDSGEKRAYDLSFNTLSNFNVCRSIYVQQIDQDDAHAGFWLAQIDNGETMQ